ncbi:MAG: hypothetical protein LBV18_04200 [Alistipes sp.]|jgi:hypothetical protein|nr:hypothetical protein [Alistipes sp.]
MKKGLLNFVRDRIMGAVRLALSPTFLFILLGAALLWYTSKLSYDYETEMPLTIRIDDQKYRLTAIVSGRGSNILAHQLSLKSTLGFTLDELVSRPSRETTGALTITPASLQRAIGDKIDDLQIVQVLEAPEFLPVAAEASGSDDGAAAADAVGGDGAGSGSVEGSDAGAAETPREKRKRERRERRQARAAESSEAGAEVGAESSESGSEIGAR